MKKLIQTTHLNNEQTELIKKNSNKKTKKKSSYVKYSKTNETLEHTNTTASDCMLPENHSNLSKDDLSQINDLSSIESLIAAMPLSTFEENSRKTNRVRAYFARINKKIKFYFKTINLILFNKPSLTHDGQVTEDLDVQNASFIYYSNFLIGLGIITVSIPNLINPSIPRSLFFYSFQIHYEK